MGIPGNDEQFANWKIIDLNRPSEKMEKMLMTWRILPQDPGKMFETTKDAHLGGHVPANVQLCFTNMQKIADQILSYVDEVHPLIHLLLYPNSMVVFSSPIDGKIWPNTSGQYHKL